MTTLTNYMIKMFDFLRTESQEGYSMYSFDLKEGVVTFERPGGIHHKCRGLFKSLSTGTYLIEAISFDENIVFFEEDNRADYKVISYEEAIEKFKEWYRRVKKIEKFK